MFERLANGWELAKESWSVLRQDKEMLIFPVISGLCGLIVLASFLGPLWGMGLLEEAQQVLKEPREAANHPLLLIATFLFYWVNYFVILFFNSALVSCAILRFRGQDPTVADGLRSAGQALPQILGWSLVAASVGMILNVIESRSEKAGKFAAALLGTAWTIATYFVVPVIVVEKTGAFQSLKRSSSIVRQTWGEAIGGNFGIGLIVMLAMIPAFIGFVGGAALISNGTAILGFVLIACAIVWIFVVSLVSSALKAILLGALYLYAADGEVPRQFNPTLFEHAFAKR